MIKQFVLKSRLTFERIRFTGYEAADSKEWYAKKILRDRSARREYFSAERSKRHLKQILRCPTSNPVGSALSSPLKWLK